MPTPEELGSDTPTSTETQEVTEQASVTQEAHEVAEEVLATPEAQELLEDTQVTTDYLKEEIAVTAGTKAEIRNGFSEFLEKLKDMWNEIKQGHILKAISMLFGNARGGITTQETSQETTDKSETTTDTTETTTTSNDDEKTESEGPTEGKDSKEVEPKDTDLVSVEEYIPSIKLDMRYATTNNFTGEKVYDSADAKLRYGTIKKLKKVQENLEKQGLSLKIWDAYRPQHIQEKFKQIVKDPSLVAQGKSDHTRGCCVDVTIVKSDGTEIPMPSEFDDFKNKDKCKSDFSAVSGENKRNGQILQNAMQAAGFKTTRGEWWHFYDEDRARYSYI